MVWTMSVKLSKIISFLLWWTSLDELYVYSFCCCLPKHNLEALDCDLNCTWLCRIMEVLVIDERPPLERVFELYYCCQNRECMCNLKCSWILSSRHCRTISWADTYLSLTWKKKIIDNRLHYLNLIESHWPRPNLKSHDNGNNLY